MHAPPPASPSAADRSAEVDAVVQRAIATHAAEPGGLLPLLHAIQDALGWLPPDALPIVALALNLSRAEVHGVISFYHDFRTRPPGRRVVKICRAESCQAMGSDALVKHACSTLGMALGSTRADGAFTLEPVYCLGNCALSPSIMVDGKLHGWVTRQRFDALMDEVAEVE